MKIPQLMFLMLPLMAKIESLFQWLEPMDQSLILLYHDAMYVACYLIFLVRLRCSTLFVGTPSDAINSST
jgi:hypothetical protein